MIQALRNESILFSHKWKDQHLAYLQTVKESCEWLRGYNPEKYDYQIEEIVDEIERTKANQLVHESDCPCLQGKG